jgi:hypothetical protein
MPRRRLSCLALLAGLLAGCASGSTEEFDRRVATYVGRPEADVIAGLGVPNRTYDGDGRRLLQYDILQPSAAPSVYPGIGIGVGPFGVGTGLGLGFGPGGTPRPCALVFEIRQGVVQGYSRNGPGCVA